jgi:EAL domain-containing protein (putative c-di-GMP-specific phosphodiesterase class I)
MDLAWLSHAEEDDEQAVLVLDGATVAVPLFEGFRSPALDRLSRGIVSGEFPAVSADTSAVAGFIRAELGLNSYATAPLTAGSEMRGLLFCAGVDTNHSLRPRDANTMRLFADTLAETIEGYELRHGTEEIFCTRASAMLAAGGPSIALQPIMDLPSRRPVAVEALSRFPVNTYTTEQWFLEARRAGCGVELELDAASAALAVLADLPAGVRLSVNASADMLSSSYLLDLLDDAPPERLILELTEHDLAPSVTGLIDRVRLLQRRGTWIAIDDAGTGYSSLHQILEIGPDIIKLDRALVTHVDSDPMKRALAHAFVTFTEEAGVALVAEGVETAAELATLEELGVPMAQGYFLARPASVAEPRAAADRT